MKLDPPNSIPFIQNTPELKNIAILVPVKSISNAKNRLSAHLTITQREALVQQMLKGVLTVLADHCPDLHKVVVTNDAWAIELGASLGFEIIRELTQRSESDSVDAACEQLEQRGFQGVLRLPLDLPLIEYEALNALLDAIRKGAPVILVPSHEGTGTNALFRSPPTRFASHFGPDSLRLHAEATRASGCEPLILQSPTLALDIDEPADLKALHTLAPAHPVSRFYQLLKD